MNQFYDEMAGVADELISEYGVAMSIIRTASDGSTITRFTKGLILDPMTYRTRPVELSSIDRRGICLRKFYTDSAMTSEDVAFELQDTDRLKVHGDWIVTRVDPVRPADTTLAVRFELRPG